MWVNLKGLFRDIIVPLICGIMVSLTVTYGVASISKVPSSSMENTIKAGDSIVSSSVDYYFSDPDYGDIVVFWKGKQRWVKRVIGLPNDVIDIIDGYVYVNGDKLDEGSYTKVLGVSEPNDALEHVNFPYTVPKDCYFLLGDNRDNSLDSRYIGAVHRFRINAKVKGIIHNKDDRKNEGWLTLIK